MFENKYLVCISLGIHKCCTLLSNWEIGGLANSIIDFAVDFSVTVERDDRKVLSGVPVFVWIINFHCISFIKLGQSQTNQNL